jgi:glutaredoxin-related protein
MILSCPSGAYFTNAMISLQVDYARVAIVGSVFLQ